ncbi:sensor histidine kinase [Actinomadura scrupuli]|uniref:sensor histidine kinase n=1 Tax=Actinomadura scrupuli TaxID=559629 RepID=UPI003D97BFC3
MCLGIGVFVLVLAGVESAGDARQDAIEASDTTKSLLKENQLPPVLHSPNKTIQVVNAQGRVVSTSHVLLGKPPMATFRPPASQVQATRTLCPPVGMSGCQTVLAVKSFQPDGIWLIYTALPQQPWYGTKRLLFAVAGTGLLITALIAAGTFRVVSRTLAPVDAIRRELAEITATGLDRRVPVPNHHEIKLMAETVNDTLDRLQGAYQQLRRFTSDASHDLRSPITAARAQLEEGLMYPDDTDWPRTATTVLTGMDRLQAIVTDLLTLARLDAGAPLTREPTDLGQLVGGELEHHDYRVPIVSRLQPGVFTVCDRLRIIRLLTNLLDNAQRHARSQVTVIVKADGSTAVLEVADDGAGIAPEFRGKVFERFTRLEASRNRDAGGTGLGLAIAREIAEAHEGTLTIEDSERGARFVLRLSRCDAPADR